MYSFHTQHLSEITKLAHVKTECNYGEGVEGGQVRENLRPCREQVGGPEHLRFLRQVGAVALILNMSGGILH